MLRTLRFRGPCVVVWVMALFCIGSNDAQVTHSWSKGFGWNGADGPVVCAAEVTSGGVAKLYLGGDFQKIGDAFSPVVAVWDGETFDAVPPVPFGSALSMCAFDDGSGEKLHVLGLTTATNPAVNPSDLFSTWSVWRLDGSGWSQVGQPMTCAAALIVFDFGNGPELVCAGATYTGVAIPYFLPNCSAANYGGTPVPSGVVHLVGGQWVPLGVPTVPVSNVRDITIFNDGSGPALYVIATTSNLTPTVPLQSRVLKLNGGNWVPYSPVISGLLETIRAIDLGQGDVLYAGGQLLALTSQIMKVTPGAFLPMGTLGPKVNAVAVVGEGSQRRLVVGGQFTVGSGASSVTNLATWNGASWQSFDGLSIPGVVRTIVDIGVGGLRRVMIGANQHLPIGEAGITFWDGVTADVVTRQNIDGPVVALGTYDDGTGRKLYAGGPFTRCGRTNTANIAKWNGATWSPVGSGANGDVQAFCEFTGGAGSSTKLIIGGAFSVLDGVAAVGIAALDGTVVSNIGNVQNGAGAGKIWALCSYDDGTGATLFAGGEFTSIGGVPAVGLAKWDGQSWSAVGGGLANGAQPPVVYALEVFDDGTGPALYIGGYFNGAANGGISKGIVRWNGATLAAVGGGLQGATSVVYALRSHDDGNSTKLYVGGDFASAGSTSAVSLASWNGTMWAAVGTPLTMSLLENSSAVGAIASFDEGDGRSLIVGGFFDGAVGVPSPRILRFKDNQWHAMAGGVGIAIPPGFNNTVLLSYVFALAAFDDGYCNSLFVGGGFTRAGNIVSRNIAAWRPNSGTAACATVLGPEADGNVGEGFGGPFQILTVNNSIGRDHHVVASVGGPLVLRMGTPPTTPFHAGFTVFGILRQPTAIDSFALPLGLGSMSFLPCPFDASNPELFILTDSLGLSGCQPLLGGAVTPWIYPVSGGASIAITFALQGLVVDPSRPLGLALTNTVVVEIR